MMSHRNNKKEALLLRKEELLRELKYYDKRIEELRNCKSNASFYEDESSDSEDFPEFSTNSGPSLTELKLQASALRTCLHATQELTNLQILQSEVNVLVEEPAIEGEPPVSCPGVWREVSAECRADLVPFAMSFWVHTPDHRFSPRSYRNLQVMTVKAAHEKELSRSVLPGLKTPSDAVEVVRGYARAQRSRRSTLARLAERFPDTLHMQPRPEGGYLLRCAGLLEVMWELQNKWSPVAPFHHRMKFELEYMDEPYIKIISSAHRRLSDPAIDTDERTALLARIIDTCIEAARLGGGVSSDEGQRSTLDEEPEHPAAKVKDSEIMAPPRTVPKRPRNANSVKRRAEDASVAKRMKRDETSEGKLKSRSEPCEKSDRKLDSDLQGASGDRAGVKGDKNSANGKENRIVNENKKVKKNVVSVNVEKHRKTAEKSSNNQKQKAVDNIFNAKTITEPQTKVTEKNVTRMDKQISKKDIKTVIKTVSKHKVIENESKSKNKNKNKIIAKNIEKDKDKKKSEEDTRKKENTLKEKENKIAQKPNEIEAIRTEKPKSVSESKHLSVRFLKDNKKQIEDNVQNKNSGTNKVQTQLSEARTTKTKIPQKKPTVDALKKNPLRISPRKQLSPLNSTKSSSNSLKTITKTNIPKLVRKPTSKPK